MKMKISKEMLQKAEKSHASIMQLHEELEELKAELNNTKLGEFETILRIEKRHAEISKKIKDETNSMIDEFMKSQEENLKSNIPYDDNDFDLMLLLLMGKTL